MCVPSSLRAATGMRVWSSGRDITELPRGRRDPLGYNDPLEELIRAVRTFPAPIIAMVHGSVWGGAFDLVLSCDCRRRRDGDVRNHPRKPGASIQHHRAAPLPRAASDQPHQGAVLRCCARRRPQSQGVAGHKSLGGCGGAGGIHLGPGRDHGVKVASGHLGDQGTAPRPQRLPAHRGPGVRTHPRSAAARPTTRATISRVWNAFAEKRQPVFRGT